MSIIRPSRVEHWSESPVSADQAKQYFETVASYNTTDGDTVISKKVNEKLMSLYSGAGMGSELKSAKNTVWGLINAVTEYVDHHRGRTNEVRLDRAWFGDGVNTKEKAIELAEQLVLA